MSSVWDDPDYHEEEEVTPLPEIQKASPAIPLAPEKLEDMTHQVIERVVREIVPELAEKIIREELDRLLREESES